MDRNRVTSTSVNSIGYDPNTKTLEVEWKNGSIYQYLGLDLDEAENVIKAPSIGAMINQRIKPRYTAKRVA